MDAYRDIVWDFLPDQVSASATGDANASFRLRVFDSEMALFGATPDSAPTMEYSVRLRLDFGALYQDMSNGPAGGFSDPRPLMEIGRSLWHDLPHKVTSRLQDTGVLEKSNTRLKVVSDEYRVNDLPWEWLSDGDEYPVLVRSVPVLAPTPPLSVKTPLKLLLVDATPQGANVLTRRSEFQTIALSLPVDKIRLERLTGATAEAVYRALREYQPHILHYVGRASAGWGGASISLLEESGTPHWFSAAELASALPLSVRLVCLSSCFLGQYQGLTTSAFSRFAYAPAEFKIPTVIYNQYELSEKGIESFWRAYYETFVASGADVTKAYVTAQRATGGADRGALGLVIRDGCDRPFRFDEEGDFDERLVTELRAQFAARSVNKLAEKVRVLGTLASESERRNLLEEYGRASEILKRLM
jgi:hypothetical protein